MMIAPKCLLALAMSLWTLAATCPASVGAPPNAPNVVIIFTDDQGYGDLSCYGHPTIHTPHLDRLAAEGMKLTQFYVASPVCSPSRAALLTGCYPKRLGMHEHVIFPPYDYGLHTDEITIADLLSALGYRTGCIGKWHLGHRDGLMPTDQGFDEYFGVPYSNDMSRFHRKETDKYPHRLPLIRGKTIVEWEPDQRLLTRRFTEEAVAFIERHRNERFFLYLAHSMPHIPLYASEAFAGRSPHGLYGDVIEEIDWSVGQVREALRRHGIENDTMIVFASDNGPWLPFKTHGGSAGPLRGGKGSTWEGGQRVPCLVAWPGRVPAGAVCRQVATAMDVLPTIAALAGAELPADRRLDGHDVTPLLLGTPGAASPTEFFLYYTSRGALSAIRRREWKLVLESGALYHVEEDIGERWDLAERHPDLVAELRALAHARDAEIAEHARPVLHVDTPLWGTSP
jgi:arylsulfatase A-like enzyme